jgi:hypothetical protein
MLSRFQALDTINANPAELPFLAYPAPPPGYVSISIPAPEHDKERA